ncbi:PDZ domain-containing protein [Pyxidicoccus trucidator]|uniref:PDZ domain-containing protein n=1 Tax=Pyxidicoccus trucidator TaxID=2709662 RepID=UPI0013D9443A|nr:hypothetical protein [Pyxidicoccus trucidator]
MERFTRKQFWLLSGALILFAIPVAASAMNLLPDFKLSRFIPELGDARPRSVSATGETPSIVIERERIVIPASGPSQWQSPTPSSTPAITAAPWSGIRMIGEHAYEVPGTDVRTAMTYPDTLAGQARIVPMFREGQPQGFKLFAIRPGSLAALLGLQNGDVLQRVNGQSLKTPEGALAAYESLRETRHIELDLERGGVPVRKTYDVR